MQQNPYFSTLKTPYWYLCFCTAYSLKVCQFRYLIFETLHLRMIFKSILCLRADFLKIKVALNLEFVLWWCLQLRDFWIWHNKKENVTKFCEIIALELNCESRMAMVPLWSLRHLQLTPLWTDFTIPFAFFNCKIFGKAYSLASLEPRLHE